MNQNLFKEEVQVGVTSLVASLGLYKTQELIDFIGSIKGSNLSDPDYFHLSAAFIGFILYIGYLGSVGASLIFIYKDNPKNHKNAILFAVASYFALQILLLLIVWNSPKQITG